MRWEVTPDPIAMSARFGQDIVDHAYMRKFGITHSQYIMRHHRYPDDAELLEIQEIAEGIEWTRRRHHENFD